MNTVERNQIQQYVVNTIRVDPLEYEGKKSTTRYETIILYIGKYSSPLNGKFYTSHSFDEAMIKHHEFLQLVVDRLAFLERT